MVQRLKHLQRVDIQLYVGEPFRLPPLNGANRDEVLQTYTDEIMCRIAVLLPPAMRGVYAGHPRLKELLLAKA